MNNTEKTLNEDLLPISKIQEAAVRISEVVELTPFRRNTGLSNKFQANIFLKREDLQVVRSFKIRGAFNKIKSLNKDELSNGIITSSAGNHAQGVAFSCNHLGIKGKIFMPNPTPKQKIKKVLEFGKEWVEIVLTGDTYDDAFDAAWEESQRSNAVFIHPFNDVDVIAGQGTIAAEILSQSKSPLDYLIVAVGGGGLLAGVASYFNVLSPNTKIIAVESTGAAAFQASLEAQKVVKLEQIDTFADGIAVKEIGSLTYPICASTIHKHILVPEGKICVTILELYNDEAIVVEPAGAIPVSALDSIKEEIIGKNVGVIICGGNNDIERTPEIKERALLHQGLKHYFVIRFPQRAGALKDFLQILGPEDDITHFQYTKKNHKESGPALVGIELSNASDFDGLVSRLKKLKLDFEHINNNSMLFEILV